MTVVDASVVVAAHSPSEARHDLSAIWWKQTIADGCALCAPAFLLPEVASAVMRSTGDAALVAQLVEQLRAGPVVLEPVTESLSARAAEIAAAHGLRGCDAVYVALAERRGEDLVTFDRHQLEQGATVVATSTPGDHGLAAQDEPDDADSTGSPSPGTARDGARLG